MLANELGMRSTRRDPDNAFWSWTWTTPSDQRLLMDKILHGTPALAEQDRFYLIDLMGKVRSDQAWGVGAPGGDDVTVQLKNGWVQFESTDKLWAVNSMGRVEGEGRNYILALMCRVPTFQLGRRLLDGIGGDVFEVMGAGRLA